ncbi:MAG: MBL fold metallo-hydrolase [Candidatus Magnetoovum sp. WYHC-5]|nr:MBL fold metallo-hydrolase [Candidatus Magnetoovum sp. WYHC-5]
MKIRFWGVRGSIASPGPRTVKYGGNTTCISVETDGQYQIILDAGTGINVLGQHLLKKLPVKCALFITHTHWDHINGLPFFVPIFIPGNTITVFGAFEPVYKKNIGEILTNQLVYYYFPVREAELKATMRYVTLKERQTVKIGETKVTGILMSHPILDFGYKVEYNGKSMFFTGDHEPPHNIYTPEDEYYKEYEELITQKEQAIIDFISGVDVLICDSSYTTAEYASKKGWGHGTFDSCMELANKANVKNLYFTHHEPMRSDDDIERIYNEIIQTRGNDKVKYFLAQEGLEIDL